ncbi:thioredoxin-domain-containing protein [Pholiota conissans]|uniref:Thioredoxin n=1 Tax=Pholiota conissans TaxID=109636 RepID=A0A9P5ZG32_9AGAR|nr:thioredoxin-domain-containing protein [Pholiota conissans]
MTTTITHVSSVSQLNGILSQSKDKVSVIDFHATWCGPCHAIAPTFEALSRQYKNVNFLKCDVDAAADVAQKYSVSAMPTFVFLRGSTKIDQVRGADRSALESTLRRHASQSSDSAGAFSGRGQTLGGGPAPPDVVGDVKQTLDRATAGFTNIDPQLKVFLGLGALYLLFWYLG